VSQYVAKFKQVKLIDLRDNSIRVAENLASCKFPARLSQLDLRANLFTHGERCAVMLVNAWARAGKPVDGLKIDTREEQRIRMRGEIADEIARRIRNEMNIQDETTSVVRARVKLWASRLH